MAIFPFFARRLSPWLIAAGLPLAAVAQPTQMAEYGRVGRIVELHGDVALYDPEAREWTEALRNRPVAPGDRLVLQRSARAELRVGSTVLLLAQGADVAFEALDDDRLHLRLNAGSLALRVIGRNQAEAVEVRTPETVVRPQRSGQYRIDRDDESTFVAVWRGALEASGHGHLLLMGDGERHEIWIDDRAGGARSRIARMPDDRLAAWAESRFAAEDAAPQSWRYASPGITGLEDLDRHGQWQPHPEYGSVWVPSHVPAGWAPFTDGRWVWMRPWGWTWVDAQPWGFAPSYYGRWVRWGVRWVWWPGVRHAKPVFAPAVVAWVGGSNVSVGISIGNAPPYGYVPLQPWQPYVPIVVPRPPRHGHPPPRWLPPPSEPISRAARGGPPISGAPGHGRPSAPPPAANYGSQGVPVNVQVAPGAAGMPPAAPMPAVSPMPPAPPAAPAMRAEPRPDPRPAPRGDAREGGPQPHRAAPAVTPAPFSAPPRAEPPRAAPPDRGERSERSDRQDRPERRDGRADPRQRDRVQ